MIYNLTLIDPATGSRLDTFDDEMTEAQLDAFLANAHEERDVRGMRAWRFDDGWYAYICISE